MATARCLLADGHDVAFVGTARGVESRLVAEAGIRFHEVPATGFDRSRPYTAVSAALTLARALVRAGSILTAEKPDAVAGFGGYVSVPVGLAAWMRGVPLVLHEQNAIPGLANKALSRVAKGTGLTYAGSSAHLPHSAKTFLCGNPVREEILHADRQESRERLGIGESETLVLIFGGSRGARHVNQAAVASKENWLSVPGVRVLHVSGPTEYAALNAALGPESDRWRVEPYLDDMASALAASDLVVARAGATSIAEITAIGRAAVLVPYPYATDDHQSHNARALADSGAAVVIPDSELDGGALDRAVAALLSDSRARATMSAASGGLGMRDAARILASRITEVALGVS